MKRILLILFLLGFGLFAEYSAQTGGRQRERSRRGGASSLRRHNGPGNSERFARSHGRRGIFSRLFRKESPSWSNRTTGSAKRNWRENRFLFSRHRSQGKIDNATYLDKQNAKRARKRVRGNETFKSRKFKNR